MLGPSPEEATIVEKKTKIFNYVSAQSKGRWLPFKYLIPFQTWSKRSIILVPIRSSFQSEIQIYILRVMQVANPFILMRQELIAKQELRRKRPAKVVKLNSRINLVIKMK